MPRWRAEGSPRAPSACSPPLPHTATAQQAERRTDADRDRESEGEDRQVLRHAVTQRLNLVFEHVVGVHPARGTGSSADTFRLMTQRTRAYFGLVVAAALFGATFVVIKDAVVTLPPLAFVAWRFLLGAAALFVFARPRGRGIWVDGLAAGSLLFVGFATQTAGLETTSASNSALITGLYVVFTPVLAAVAVRRLPALSTVSGAVLSVVGLGFLTLTAGFTLNRGDLLTVICAVAFGAHIVVLARLAPRHAVVPFTAIQLIVVAVLSLAASAMFEGLPLPSASVVPALIGTGVIVSAGAFMLHVSAQRVIGPSRTAIVLSAEPVFATATAAFVLSERLTARGWFGAALIMAGIYVVLAFSPPEEADLIAAEGLSEAH